MRRPFDPISLIVWSLFIGVVLTLGMWFTAAYLGFGGLVFFLMGPLWFVVAVVAIVGAVGAGVRNGMTHALLDQTERRRASQSKSD